MRFVMLICISVGAVLTMGCGTEERNSVGRGVTIQVDTTGGIIFIHNSGPTRELLLRPLVRIGSNSLEGMAAEPDQFGRITSVVASRAGRIYVADALARHIKIFGGDGEYVGAFGQDGAGPGEFRELYSLALVGDTIAALDPGNARIGLLTLAGEWVGSWRHAPITGPIARLYTTGEREFYSYTVRREDDDLRSLYAGYSPAGLTGDELPYLRRQGGPPSAIICRGEVIRYYDIPFAARLISAPAPGGMLAVASTDEYRIAFIRASGDTVRVVSRETASVPVSDAEWEVGVEAYREFRKEAPDARCEPVSPPRSRTKPPIRQIFFDDVGRLWVEAVSIEGDFFEVFDAEGRLLWSVPVPSYQRGIPLYIREDRLYLVEADSFDIQSIWSFELVEGGGSL